VRDRNRSAPDEAETDLLFEHVARQDRDLTELLPPATFSERLAAFYGVSGVKGEEIARNCLESKRAGVLTHASLLISTSNPNRTSPVKRGLFVLENLLGREVPPPPPAVANLRTPARGGSAKTLREQLAAHRERSRAACHAHFGLIGLTLENLTRPAGGGTRSFGGPIDRSRAALRRDGGRAADLARVLARGGVLPLRDGEVADRAGRGLEPATP
jgi:hypothetical protein